MAGVAIMALGGRGKQKLTGEGGISGTLSADGPADVDQYAAWKQKGGWFHSDRSGRNMSAVSADTQQMLDQATAGITQSTQAYAASIGLSADAVKGYTQAIDISLGGLSPEKQQEAITQVLTSFADGMADVFGGVAALAKTGEGTSTTLARLANSLALVNGSMDALQNRLFSVSLAGADASSRLIDLMGGAENFTATTAGYFANFYTDAEQRANTVKNITSALNAAGGMFSESQIGSTSRDQFRAIVSSIDATSAASQPLYAALLGVSDAFAQITQSSADMAGAALAAAQKQSDALDKVSQSAKAASDALGTDGFSNVIDFQRARALIANPQLDAPVVYTPSGIKISRNQVEAKGGDVAALVAEIAALRMELKAAQVAQISAAKTTENIFVKWENDGLPAVRVVAA